VTGPGGLLDIGLRAFITFFVTIGPLEVVPVFLALTPGAAAAHRRVLAQRATLIASGILLVFAIGGEEVLRLLGISFAAFRLGGGVLLLLLAIDLVFARQSGLSSITPSEQREAGQGPDISVFPLAIPLLAGPGAMTAAVLLSAAQSGQPAGQAMVLAMMLTVMLLALLLLRLSSRVVELLGITGINVGARISGILLAALAAQFVLDGLQESGLFR
jgi:multiple antibiotic resistance protein